ncbi:MAG: TIGR03915 family putative DNA repair protein [Niameybacter sp.]|uniref:TIGR03915 family putative DNA repair protein n=1 Tax=Niameybacter sp. TaxID=2033640 RepID=UPI002FCCAA89
MKEFLYDGSFEGFLTAIFYAYSEKNEVRINKQSEYIPHLLFEAITIPTELDKFERVYASIQHKLSHSILKNIYYLYLSEATDCATLALSYLKLCYQYGITINLAKNNDIILFVDTLIRKVSHEAHRFTGFVRFNEIVPLCFYAQIEPNHCILPLIENHFTTRFSNQNFIIHDLRRNMALIYNQSNTYFRLLLPQENTLLNSYQTNDSFQPLFKAFYDSVTIPERVNPRLQKNFVPSRYWKHLAEMSTL